MKFKVKKTKEAQIDFDNLLKEQQKLLNDDYQNIETKGLETILTKPLDTGIFEIKTKNLRSIYKYAEGQIIIIGVIFQKKSQKTPKDIIKRAKKILRQNKDDFRF